MTGRSCGVVGSPIAHSLSPVMHRAAYGALGLDWTYGATDVTNGGLADHVKGLDPSWRGLSVTAPLKREAATLADTSDHVVMLTGVANTLVHDDDGSIAASNTDVPGAVSALIERGIDQVPLVRVLGGGATAASVAHAVAGLGAVRLELVVRDASRAEEARAAGERAGLEVGVALVDEPMLDVADLLVSTIPGGSFHGRAAELVESARAVFDVAYEPWPSVLVQAAERDRRPAATGLDLLAHQAVLQVRLMTGLDVKVDLLRDAALDHLNRVTH